MQWLTNKAACQTLLLTALLLLIIVATSMLACGPVDQPNQDLWGPLPAEQNTDGTDPPEEESAEPTATPQTSNSYPKLADSLQEVVQKYESDELSETEAAALILAHHGAMVLVQVDTSANIDAIDTWMAEQEIAPRHKNTGYTPPHIYAYVKVSLLGTLSQQNDVTAIQSLSDQFSPDELLPNPLGGEPSTGGVSGQSETDEPILPLWLQGYPYPRLGNKLERVVYRYDNGNLTEAEAASKFNDYQGTKVHVRIVLLPDTDTDTLVAWLKSKKATSFDVVKTSEFPDEIWSYVPVSTLGALSHRPGIERIETPIRPENGNLNNHLPSSESQFTAQSAVPTPTPVISQGFTKHEADHWKSNTPTYTGNGIKVGIIDTGFGQITQLNTDERPLLSKLKARCFTTQTPGAYSENPQYCGSSLHGTAVAQTIFDMASGVSLFISSIHDIQDLNAAVDWMIEQDVDIINHSLFWEFEGLGYGIPRYAYSPLTNVNKAVNQDILWVSITGNHTQRIWHSPFTDSDNDGAHEFATADERNYITFDATNRSVLIELRWDDTWGAANCNLDMHLYQENPNGTSTQIAVAKNVQGNNSIIPKETIQVGVNPSLRHYIVVRKKTCSNLSWFQLYIHQPHTLEHRTTNYTVVNPATSKNPGMLAVGAAGWYNINQVQTYSSRGPTNDGRIKPELIGADCGQVQLYRLRRTNCWFSGTSQAAPHITGMAALVKERFPHYTPAEVATYLKENAIQRIASPDPNNTWGHGFAVLPDPVPEAKFTSKPVAIQVGRHKTFRLDTNQTSAKIVINNTGDTGRLYPSQRCSAQSTTNPIQTRTIDDTNSIHLAGCTEGTATVRLYKTGTNQLLNVYTVIVGDHASLFPEPSSFTTGHASIRFRLSTTVPNPPGIRIKVTSGKLSIGGCSARNTSHDYQDGDQVIIAGCGRGAATINLHRGTSQTPLKTYSVTVNPGSSASLTTGTTASVPTSFVINQDTTYTLQTTLSASTRVDVKINNTGDAGNLMFVTSTSGASEATGAAGSSSCNGEANATQTISKGGTITIRGCSPGNATVKLFKSGTAELLESYSVAVGTTTSLAALSPPTGLTLTTVASNNRRLQLNYTDVNADYRYQFELEKLEIGSNTWFAEDSRGDSNPPAYFNNVSRGYPYRARGRSCSDSRRRICGVWTSWTPNFELSDPQAALSGLAASLTAGQSDNFTITFSDLTLDQPYTVTLNTSDDGIGFNTDCAQSLSSGFTPYSLARREAKGFTLYACDYPGGTMTAQLRKGNASGPVLKTVSQAVTASHDASLSPEPDKITFGDTYEYQLFTTATSTDVWVNKAGDTGNVSLTTTCNAETDSKAAYVGGNIVAVKACAVGRVTLRLFVADQLLETYGITIEPITASLSPEPATVQYGSSIEHLLFTNATSTAVSVKANKSTDSGNISLNSDCPGGIDSTTTYVKGNTVTIKGCATGAATLSLVLSSNSTLRTYNLIVSPVYTDILTGKLMSSARFKIYRQGNTLYYHKQPCTAADLQQRFYLHIRAVRNSDLPAHRQQYRFDNRDFPAAGNSFRFGDQCLAVAQLPSYAMTTIGTGQIHLVNNVWESTWTADFSGAAVSAPYATILSGELMADMPFKVYLKDKTLYYYKAACTQAETNNNFGLHLKPQSVSDLSTSRRTHGFDSLGFSFRGNGLRFNGSCLAAKKLPDYAIKRINTGARTGATYLWRVGFPPRTFHRPYDSIVTGTAKVTSTFNVYLKDNQIYYAKSPCTAADLEGRFRLHLTPKNRSDLPSHRQQYGFDNLDFHADRRALLAGGKCLEVIQLPSYTITRITTGQHRNGTNIWNVNFATGQ